MKTKSNGKQRHFASTRVLALGFITIILIGTLLLSLPISSASGSFTNPLDAAFTSVSASCVTGLITLDTATHWSTFGHVVIILLIQVGGLGFMTMAVLLSILIKRAITPKERMLIAASYNLNSFDSIPTLVKRIVIGTVAIEGVGALILSIRFIPDFGWGPGIFKSVFHSISAFCNAGFDIVGVGNPYIHSTSYYIEDPIVTLTLSLLIILGGIGFLVWSDIINFTTKKNIRLSVYSRFVLIITAILLGVGTVSFALLEWNNPQTLGGLSGPLQKIMASFFQSVTWRTAGFAMIDNGSFTPASQLLGILLMFIGGASGSTAGGVKVATFGILVYTVWCISVGKKHTKVFGRSISDNSFARATAVICVQLAVALIGVLIINASSRLPMMDIIYEAVSAISTVGVTTGITPELSAISKIAVMILMYFGRIGVLTVTYAVMSNQSAVESSVRYPDANMPIG